MVRYFIAFILIAAWIITWDGLRAQSSANPELTVADLKAHISYLASDELRGRYPGTEGSLAAAAYIRQEFVNAGLQLLAVDGYQEFEVVTGVRIGPANSFETGGFQARQGIDFNPLSFTKNETLAAEVIFAGYGFDIREDSLVWNDYEGIDVAGKWVMILRGDPEMDKQESKFARFGEDRDKVLTARDKGASGVLLVSGKKFEEKDELDPVYFDKTQSNAGIPVIQITRSLADRVIGHSGTDIVQLEANLIRDREPLTLLAGNKVSATTEVLFDQVTARNVVAMLEGSDPALKGTYVVVGAHYDHLGMGGSGSGSRFLDSLDVHNGADDNASGVAGILELAAKLASDRASLRRSVIFVAFDAEELGLLGSKYFTGHSPIDLNKILAMTNFDMIGRMNTENPGIMIGGTGTSLESEPLLLELETGDVKLNFSPEGFGPSDHAAFYAEDIPVFFFTTGAHEDYHTPADDWQLLNLEGERQVLEIARQLIIKLANRSEYLSFREAGPKQQTGRGGYRFKVTLGIMPDFAANNDGGGLGVGGVKKDGPAFKGGVLKGDVITAMDGKPINDIYDYMNRLKKLQPGQVVSLDVKRNGETQVLIIQL